jgi:hypothetical protein
MKTGKRNCWKPASRLQESHCTYKMPAGTMDVRLVHLLDEQKRKELMIIYGEDVAPTGFTAAELREGGKAHSEWPVLEKDLIERARQKVAIEKVAKY